MKHRGWISDPDPVQLEQTDWRVAVVLGAAFVVLHRRPHSSQRRAAAFTMTRFM
jgi:hypothetical protein